MLHFGGKTDRFAGQVQAPATSFSSSFTEASPSTLKKSPIQILQTKINHLPVEVRESSISLHINTSILCTFTYQYSGKNLNNV